jgi:hypothetical protein
MHAACAAWLDAEIEAQLISGLKPEMDVKFTRGRVAWILSHADPASIWKFSYNTQPGRLPLSAASTADSSNSAAHVEPPRRR